MASPRFKHDCHECKFIGNSIDATNDYDLYFCEQGGIDPTVIARFGNAGEDYVSGLGSKNSLLREAELRAKRLGLIKS